MTMDTTSTPNKSNPSPINQLATKFGVSTDKPHFPVNTMRLFYLILADGLTNSDQEVIDRVNQVIPKISTLFDARDQFLQDQGETDPLREIEACRGAINDIFTITNNPVVHHTFDLLFSDLYPLQENILLSLDRHLSEEHLQISDLAGILKIRSMDAVVYSSIIFQIIQEHFQKNSDKDIYHAPSYSTTPVHWQVSLTLQINDLCDAVIFAKDDLNSGSATLIDIIKKISTKPDDVEAIIFSVFDQLQKQSNKLPFSQPLQSTVKQFHQALIHTIRP